MATHMCAVVGCTALIGLEQVMCRTHWRRVPKQLRLRVWGSRGSPGEHDYLVRLAAREATRIPLGLGAAVAHPAATSAPAGRPPGFGGGNGSGGRALKSGRAPPGYRRM